ncbi:MAG: phospholipase [Acidobacteriota bacterium]|nr:phospholipase [Acidobacteriota bacterium]
MLGYLSLPPSSRADVDGQRTDPEWLTSFTNLDQGEPCRPRRSTNPFTLPPGFDPPHERANVAAQLGALQDGAYPMTGFVEAIPSGVSSDPATRRMVMDFFDAGTAPVTDFLARHFTICDRWFARLPGGTQANRLMAMSGTSTIDGNRSVLPRQELVYDWLTRHHVRWRVYHQGIPFFTLMPHWIPEILGNDHFRAFMDFQPDLVNTPLDELPDVIFLEPTYGDAPHLGRSTDDHAPSGVSNGQEFLMEAYNAITRPSFWKGALLIITYDEHGGFFDHVSPPSIPTNSPAGEYPPFPSLGVRVPAYVVSPFVKAGGVSNALLDHTSMLKLLGEKFNKGSYSAAVDARQVKSVSAVLDFSQPITHPKAPDPVDDYLNQRPQVPPATLPPVTTKLREAFRDAAAELKRTGGLDHPKFGELVQHLPEGT